LPSFGAEISTGNITENWLFKLANDSPGFLYLAFSDVTDSGNFYHGVILNKPSIRESIDLSNSTSKTSNVSISMPDFTYQGNPISEELFGGSNHYINQTVSVYSKVGSATTQIGSFRLTDISSDGGKISISMASHRPWDFISIPQVKHSKQNIYEPTVYGAFNYSDKTDASYNGLYPVPVISVSDNLITTLMPRLYSSSDNNFLHYSIGQHYFLPLLATTSTTTVVEATYTESGINALDTPTSYVAQGYFVPLVSQYDPSTVTFLTDKGNAFDISDGDWDTSTFAKIAVTNDATPVFYLQSQTLNRVFDSTVVDRVKLRMGVVINDESGTNQLYDMDFFSNNNADNILSADNKVIGLGSTGSNFEFDFDTPPSNVLYSANAVACPDELLIKWDKKPGGPVYITEPHELRCFGVKILPYVKFNKNDNDRKRLSDIKFFYAGGNGLAKSGWESSGEIAEIHDAHLDMLIRFADLKQSDGTAITTPTDDSEVDGFNSLNTDRAGWNIRWWQLEPESLEKTLNKLAYEGCFIFRYKADGSPQYIHIKDSHTVDETLTKADISSVSVKPSSFSELLTKVDISYGKNHADGNYSVTVESVNSSSRTDWAIQTKENIKKVDLDAYVAPTIPATPSTNPNDDFYTYYDNIFGDIKLIVSGTIVNPKYYNLEVGKVLAFSDMYPIKAFNTSWSGLKFMITGLTRTAGTLKFEAREI